MNNSNSNKRSIIDLIKDIINSESLKEKYNIINKDIFIIITNIIDKNPDFFILIEKVLLELVKDNKINLTIFNYAFFQNKLLKLFDIFSKIRLNELDNITLDNFADLLKFSGAVIYDSNNVRSFELLDKFCKLIDNVIDFIKLIKHI
jgi:hypothetical protein